jgi:hypothetical protein
VVDRSSSEKLETKFLSLHKLEWVDEQINRWRARLLDGWYKCRILRDDNPRFGSALDLLHDSSQVGDFLSNQSKNSVAATTFRNDYGSSNVIGFTQMPTEQILALLIAERDKLNSAIEVLQGPIKRRGRPPKNVPTGAGPDATERTKRTRRTFSAAQREAAAERMRQRWAAKKAGVKSQRKSKKAAESA